ncbi:hypothetical protein, partial [Anoxynatronum buryatiense]|uniref:hypothetical protein n=1 Tax=Anoxynatronum buryatiense TaxID=489973 RepID=UPI0024B7BC86
KKNKNLTKKVAARLTFKGSYGFNFSVLLSNSRGSWAEKGTQLSTICISENQGDILVCSICKRIAYVV